jgi:hypothetical protein
VGAADAARYAIGTGGVIAYAEVNPDYTLRPNPSELPGREQGCLIAAP